MFFASFTNSQASLPVFISGALLSKPFAHNEDNDMLARLQTVAFSVIAPILFIVNGSKVSIPLIIGSFGILLLIFIIRQIGKLIGVYFVAESLKYNMHIPMIMGAGLTFGLVVAVYGLNNDMMSSNVYSILTGILVSSAVIPSFIGNKYCGPG